MSSIWSLPLRSYILNALYLDSVVLLHIGLNDMVIKTLLMGHCINYSDLDLINQDVVLSYLGVPGP